MKHWTEKELKVLRANYSKLTPKQIAKKLPGRAVGSIRDKAEKLKLRSYKSWSPEDIEYLKNNYTWGAWPTLVKKLGRSKATIVAYANRVLGLRKKNRPNAP